MYSRSKASAAALTVGALLAIQPAGAQTGPPPTSTQPAAPAQAAAAPPPPTPIAFEEAVLKAANDLFSKAGLPGGASDKVELVIDPLIDGVTGAQSLATRSMEQRIVDLVRKNYPRFEVKPFSTAAVAKAPIVLIGTFTAINNAGQPQGPRDAYRVCLALADLKERKIISKGVARAKPEGINATPTAYFNDSPVFAKDAATEAYVKSCQGTKAGDPIDQVYADRIQSAALLSDAINAYDARRYREALDLYQSALKTPGGDQLRAHNGIYLANWKLGRRAEASEAFGKVVDYGLASNRLAVKFLFRPGSTQFVSQRRIRSPYPVWLKQVAERSAKGTACLEVVGHTSKTGPEPFNLRLSALRALEIKDRLGDISAPLGKRVIAIGAGSQQTLIGTGRDDASDALDRRVEFKVINC